MDGYGRFVPFEDAIRSLAEAIASLPFLHADSLCFTGRAVSVGKRRGNTPERDWDDVDSTVRDRVDAVSHAMRRFNSRAALHVCTGGYFISFSDGSWRLQRLGPHSMEKLIEQNETILALAKRAAALKNGEYRPIMFGSGYSAHDFMAARMTLDELDINPALLDRYWISADERLILAQNADVGLVYAHSRRHSDLPPLMLFGAAELA